MLRHAPDALRVIDIRALDAMPSHGLLLYVILRLRQMDHQ